MRADSAPGRTVSHTTASAAQQGQRGVGDRAGVDAVQRVGVLQPRGLPELGDAQAADPVAPRRRRGTTACAGARRARSPAAPGARGGKSSVDDVADRPRVRLPRCCQDRNTRSGLVRQTTPAVTPVGSQQLGSREHLGHDRADADQRDLLGGEVVGGDPVAARDRLPAAPLEQRRLLGQPRPGRGRSAGSRAGSTPTSRRARRPATSRAGSTTPGPVRTPAPRPRSPAAPARSTAW